MKRPTSSRLELESPRPARVLMALALASAAFATGCGGSDDDEGSDSGSGGEPAGESAPAPPTKAEFIAEADSVCKKGKAAATPVAKRSTALGEQFNGAASADAQVPIARKLASLTRKAAAIKDRYTDQLEALEAPEGGAPDGYFASRRKTTVAQRQVADGWAAYAKSPTQATADKLNAIAKRYEGLVDRDIANARRYGFKVCGGRIKV